MNENNNPGSDLQNSEQQLHEARALGGPDAGKPKRAPRIMVRFVSMRRRQLDRDNLLGGCKGLLDGLRYAGLIPGDGPEEIDFDATQIIIRSQDKEKTIVQITYPT